MLFIQRLENHFLTQKNITNDNIFLLYTDTETLYTKAYGRITQEYGKTYTWEHKAKIMGFNNTDAVQTIIDLLELPITAQAFEDKLFALYRELFPQCNLMPGDSNLNKVVI